MAKCHPRWQPTRRWATSCGLGRRRIRTQDCRTTVWRTTIEPLYVQDQRDIGGAHPNPFVTPLLLGNPSPIPWTPSYLLGNPSFGVVQLPSTQIPGWLYTDLPPSSAPHSFSPSPNGSPFQIHALLRRHYDIGFT